MNEFVAPYGDLLIAPEHQGWAKATLDRLTSDSFAQDFTQKVNIQETAGDGDIEFWDSRLAFARPYTVRDGVLTIPVQGMLLNKFPYQFGSWATGYEYVEKAIERGVDDDDVDEIVLDVNSPGGLVAGCFDCADAIYAARGTKPIRAFADESAYSAAYALASAADSINVARTGGVGSIGVLLMHASYEGLLDNAGIKITFIHSGKHKADGNPYEDLPDDVLARFQERSDKLYEIFVSTVSRNRALSKQVVRDTEALTFMAQEAVENGLADAVGPLGTTSADADPSHQQDEDDEMSKDNSAVDQAAHESAVATARQEGHTAGKAEGVTEGKAQGATAERERISAIIGCDEAKTRPVAANQVAMNTDMDLDAAKAFLSGLKEETAESQEESTNSPSQFEQQMNGSQNPNIGADGGEGNEPEMSTAQSIFARAGYAAPKQ